MNQKTIVVVGVALFVLIGGYFLFFNNHETDDAVMEDETALPEVDDMSNSEDTEETEVSVEVSDLSGRSWQWQSAVDAEGATVEATNPEDFVLTFDTSGRFSAATDCNSIGGSYSVNDGALMFGTMISTKMYCEGSQEEEFAALMSETTAYTIKDETLMLELAGEGSMTFTSVASE
jgi:heat shock protein HslJ